MGKRHFGTVRRRTSGSWQALYTHEGRIHSAGTFPTKADALACLSEIQVSVRRGVWLDPRAGDIWVMDYAEKWLAARPELAERTRELYGYLLSKYIGGGIGNQSLSSLSATRVREWYSQLAVEHPSTASKAYRLLATIMKTAMVDGLISSTPCRVVGASTERAEERPTATPEEVEALHALMPDFLSLVISLAAWCQLRRGEILGLRRRDVSLDGLLVHVEQSRTFLRDGSSLIKAPKTRAGRRVVAVPASVGYELRNHLDRFVDKELDSLIVVDRNRRPVSAMVVQRAWMRARTQIGRPELHLHDLRHTGLTLAAAAGATTAELMHRAGHASAEAALRYQHATRDRDLLLANTLEAMRWTRRSGG